MSEAWFFKRPWFLPLIACAVGALAVYTLEDAWARDGAPDDYSGDTQPASVEGVQRDAALLVSELRHNEVSLDRIGRTIQALGLPDSHSVSKEYVGLKRQQVSLRAIVEEIKERAASVNPLQRNVDRDTLTQLAPEVRSLSERVEKLRILLRI